METKHKVKVVVSGVPGSGKSIITGIILKALKDANIEVVEESFQDMMNANDLTNRLDKFDRLPDIGVQSKKKA